MVTGQCLEPDRAVLACRVLEPDEWCHRCGGQGVARDTVTRRLAHEPLGWRPTTLLVTVRRYRCADCAHVWAPGHQPRRPNRGPSSRAGRCGWALSGIVCQHLSVARIAEGARGSPGDTANNAVLEEGRRRLIADPNRFDAVAVIGVDEHCWRHTRRGDKFVTVIIDLTPVRDQTGPARLLDMVEGRSKQVFKTWLAAQTPRLPGRHRGRRDGRIHRLQDRRRRDRPRRRRGHGPLPRRRPGRRCDGPLPATHPTADLRTPRPFIR